MNEDLSESPEVRCILELARALLSLGLAAHRVEEAVERLGRAFGLTTAVLGLPTTLSISVRRGSSSDVFIVRCEPRAMDLSKLDGLHAIIGRIERGTSSADAALRAMDVLVRARPHARESVRWLAGGLVATSAVPAFRGGGYDYAAAFVLGTLVAVLASRASNRRIAHVTTILSALGVALASSRLAAVVPGLHPIVVTLCALLVLLPGFPLTMATVELATGHWVSGSARATGASLVFLELGFGVVLGAKFGALGGIAPVPVSEPGLGAVVLGAVGIALGFAILGNARREDAIPHATVCLIAFGLCQALAPLGAPVATLVAAFATAIASHAFARRYDRPTNVLLVPGAWMLVPGGVGLLGLSAVLLHDDTLAVDSFVGLVTTALAIGTGFVLATSVLPPRTEL